MKLIYENDSNLTYTVSEELNEASGTSEKKYRIKGVFSTIGEKNRNGRIYPRNIWESQVGAYQNNFQTGSLNLLCEYEHPARTNVDPMEAVARIEKLYIKDKFVMGEAVLLNNPKANQLKSLIEAGIKLSVSSRGVGSVSNGIVTDFRLVTYDIVSDPSDFNATMNGMVESFQLNEGVLTDKEFKVTESGNIEEVQVCSSNVCHMFEKTDVQNAFREKFKQILNEISGNSKTKTGTRGKTKIEISLEKGFVRFDEIDRKFEGDDNTIGIKHFKDDEEAKKVFNLLKCDMTDKEVLKYLDKP